MRGLRQDFNTTAFDHLTEVGKALEALGFAYVGLDDDEFIYELNDGTSIHTVIMLVPTEIVFQAINLTVEADYQVLSTLVEGLKLRTGHVT